MMQKCTVAGYDIHVWRNQNGSGSAFWFITDEGANVLDQNNQRDWGNAPSKDQALTDAIGVIASLLIIDGCDNG
jgi:hypothetical protein